MNHANCYMLCGLNLETSALFFFFFFLGHGHPESYLAKLTAITCHTLQIHGVCWDDEKARAQSDPKLSRLEISFVCAARGHDFIRVHTNRESQWRRARTLALESQS